MRGPAEDATLLKPWLKFSKFESGCCILWGSKFIATSSATRNKSTSVKTLQGKWAATLSATSPRDQMAKRKLDSSARYPIMRTRWIPAYAGEDYYSFGGSRCGKQSQLECIKRPFTECIVDDPFLSPKIQKGTGGTINTFHDSLP